MITLPYLTFYIERLRAHDWHYEQSDDPRVFKAGQAAKLALQREAKLDDSGMLQSLYEAMERSAWRRSSGPHQVVADLTFDEYAAVILKRIDPKASMPTAVQKLAKIVHTLAVALARADPDNRAPQRALDALQSMGLLEATLTTPPKEAAALCTQNQEVKRG
jgi:hypothetical protein